MSNKRVVFAILSLIMAGGAIFLMFGKGDMSVVDPDKVKKKVVIYKPPTCGCCVKYSQYLKKNGFEVEVVAVDDMSSIKDKYSIPRKMESCHTTMVGDYFIEGHVPADVIDSFLALSSDVDGIALPDMPAGSPGMPGTKRGVWQIYGLKDGEVSKFTTY